MNARSKLLLVVSLALLAAGCKSGGVKDDPLMALSADEALTEGKALMEKWVETGDKAARKEAHEKHYTRNPVKEPLPRIPAHVKAAIDARLKTHEPATDEDWEAFYSAIETGDMEKLRTVKWRSKYEGEGEETPTE